MLQTATALPWRDDALPVSLGQRMRNERVLEPVPEGSAAGAVDRCDVLVIGGGPAGATLSRLLAEKGRHVVLLEKDRHPRFHIGESLLPMNLPILERLGLLEQVRAIGLLKPGVEMCSDSHPSGCQTYRFEKAKNLRYPYAFEVRRSEFDALLMRHTAAGGACVYEGVKVIEVEPLADDATKVTARDENGRTLTWQARFLVDASGRSAFLATRSGRKVKNPKHNAAAVFGHFENAERRHGRDEGNIALYWFAHGWIWMIPLRDGTMSVGAVCWPDYLKGRKGSLDDFLWDTLRLSPGVAARLSRARLKGAAQATGNYSYRATRMSGPGFLLLGDAYAFIDPVFSSGVYLGLKSAVMGADAVDTWLQDRKAGAQRLAALEKELSRGLARLSWFIYRFTTPAIHALFMAPRNLFGMEQAVLSLLAGDVFGQRRGGDLPLVLFKGLYYVTTGLLWAKSWAAYRRRKQNRAINVTSDAPPLGSTPSDT